MVRSPLDKPIRPACLALRGEVGDLGSSPFVALCCVVLDPTAYCEGPTRGLLPTGGVCQQPTRLKITRLAQNLVLSIL